jgi:hypothetical protein
MAAGSGSGSPPLYKYVSIDVLKRILSGSIRFTQPGAFNDPFELLPEVVTPDGEPERKFPLRLDIMAPRRNPPIGDVDEILTGHRASDATARTLVEELNTVIGILCLSKNGNSLLMWSHYAEQYAGAVVEFDATHEFFAGQIDVEYRARRPKKHVSILTEAVEPLPLAELCAKSQEWGYEAEVRIARQLAECEQVGVDGRDFPVFVQKIPRDAIKSIIVGERTKIADQQEIYRIIKETKIGMLLAAVDEVGYEFRYERIKFNEPLSKMQPMMSPRTAHIFADAATQQGEFARWLVKHHPLSKIVNKTV